jgi:hypothetical protein
MSKLEKKISCLLCFKMPNITTLPGKKALNFLENLMAWMVLGFEFSRFFFQFFQFFSGIRKKGICGARREI